MVTLSSLRTLATPSAPMPLQSLPSALGGQGDDAAFSRPALDQMERMLSDFGRVYRERNAALKELERAHLETLLRLATAAELRDDDTGVHIVRMGYVAEALGLWLGLSRGEARDLRLAAPMHDIGKIGVADRVLKKPGALSEAERSEMQSHPAMGAEILGSSRIPLFQLAAQVAMTHHERWDGSGYPRGLAGEAIPMSGRIVAVADFFDALTMDRCYRPAFSDESAVGMLLKQSGRAFDPRVVDALIEHLPEVVALRNAVNVVHPTFADLPDLDAGALLARAGQS
jgi:putative two-component system response regulator